MLVECRVAGKGGGVSRGRLVGGLVCLVVGVFLIVLSYALPEEEMMFRVGGANSPSLPGIILAIVGAALVGTAWIGRR